MFITGCASFFNPSPDVFFQLSQCEPVSLDLLTSVGPPELLHAVPHQDDARQLRERLDDIEVAQRAHFEKRHAVLLGVRPGLLCGNLPLEGQMQSVTYEDSRHARRMLGEKN